MYSLGAVFDVTEQKQTEGCLTFTPSKPIRQFVYRCAKNFCVEPLLELEKKHDRYGLIILRGDEVSMFIVSGSEIENVYRQTARLSKKHSRGGQSQNRFARLREESIDNYITLTQEHAVECFIDAHTTLPSVRGLIIAGPGDKKNKLVEILDGRLQRIVIGVVAATEHDHASAIMERVTPLIAQDKHQTADDKIHRFFETMETNDAMVVYGQQQTLQALKDGSLAQILVVEDGDEKLLDQVQKLVVTTGCELLSFSADTVLGNRLKQLSGDIAGIRWFASSGDCDDDDLVNDHSGETKDDKQDA